MRKIIVPCLCLLLSATACKEKKAKEAVSQETAVAVSTTLFDKSLPEIKKHVDGKWELVSGQNARELNEFENTFIEFDGDNYVWTEDGQAEKGALNWRKEATGAGYDAYLMDVFYAEYPAYPVSVKGDTLLIQDCTETAYRYKLVRRR